MKNTKIMAVLVVLLAAMLFVGAASAATFDVDLTPNETIYHDGQKVQINMTWTSAIDPTNMSYVNQSVNVSYDGSEYSFGEWINAVSNATFTAEYGVSEIQFVNNTAFSQNNVFSDITGLSTISINVVRDLSKGGDAFVYETIYTGGALTLRNNESGLVNMIPADENGYVELLESSVDGKYGEYKIGTTDTMVNIWYPELTLVAYLEGTTDSIDGKTVGKLDDVSFYVEAPKVAAAKIGAKVTIWFTTTVGGKTSVYGIDYANKGPLTQARELIGTSAAGDTIAAGTYTAYAEFQTPKSFKDYADKSNTITFTVQSTSLSITAAQDSVVRSNPFSVTISGAANKEYYVSITNPETDINKNPELQPGQSGYKGSDANGYLFETDASGKRTIQFNTDANTEDKTFTIRVTNASDVNDWDEEKIKVEKGAVTISASGDGSYYIGTEITLSGTNTDSDSVYLFITGPNLDSNGEKLLNLGTSAIDGGSQVSVKTDNTWEQKWNTAGSGLDTGAYTIYATSSEVGKSKLSDTEYATVSVSLKQPFLSAVPSGTIIAKGDDLYIRGTAEGEPNELKIYIFGPNKFEDHSVNVEDDGTYEKKIKIDSDWASNQYFVVIQHPMYNGDFDAKLNKTKSNAMFFYIANAGTDKGDQASFYVTGKNKLQGSNAADALTKMIDNANIDDIYTKLTFTVTEPRIDITNPGDQGVGTKFTISGTTNLAVGDQIIVEVASSSFEAIEKTSTSITDGVSVTTKVVAGEGADNAWSVEVDTTNWKLDEYTIKATGIEVDVTATTNFNLVEKTVTPTATATATGTTTATATATATATPATPGFGAFVALAGLGAVALLVLRRN